MFGIVTKFPRRKSDNILHYFRGRNPAMLHFMGIIVHKTLFSSSFCYENTATMVPHFLGENPTEFHVWYDMVHRQGFMPMYTASANMLELR